MSATTWDLLIVNAKVAAEQTVIENGYVAVHQGKIAAIGSVSELDAQAAAAAAETVDAQGSWLLPGFVDVHVHGGYGGDFMDASQESLDRITKFHLTQGTTTILATSVTGPREALANVIESAHQYRQQEQPYAKLGGVHLEGPFISPKWPGAQNPAFIVPPQIEWLDAWTSQYPGLIRLITLAPEAEGALPFISRVTEQGVRVAAGHTDSTYTQIREAVAHGLTHAVHTFNAMTGLHHREPGVVGAVLTEDAIHAEVIADGHHVHAACIKLLTQAKRKDNLVLITDAISAAGLGDGDYDLGGLAVIVKDGVARLKEGGALAGSTLTMISALRFMVNIVGLSVAEASRLGSYNPAKAVGLSETIGSIAAGKAADLLLVNEALNIDRIWVDGKAKSVSLD